MAYDPLQEIEALREQQKKKAYSDLEAQKNNSLSQLNQEKSQIQPQYYKSRNEASTSSQLQAKNFAEYMANRGLSSSGTAAQAELTRNVGLQGQIGALNKQENAAYSDIARRQTDTNNAFNTGLTSAYAGIDSDVNSQIINYRNQLAQEQRQREYEIEQARIAFERQKEMEAIQYQQQLALQRQSQAAAAAKARSSSNNSNAAAAAKAQKEALEAQKKDNDSKYNNYLDLGYKMYNTTDDYGTSKYSNDQMVSWVNNLDLPDNYKVSLLNSLNLEKPALPASNALNGNTADAWRMLR